MKLERMDICKRMYNVSCILTIQAVVFIFRIQTAEPSLHSTHTYSAQNASDTHLWLNDPFLGKVLKSFI